MNQDPTTAKDKRKSERKKRNNGDISVELLNPGELARSDTHPAIDLQRALQGNSAPPMVSHAVSHAAEESEEESDDEDYLVSV
jgi:hypothetical protein